MEQLEVVDITVTLYINCLYIYPMTIIATFIILLFLQQVMFVLFIFIGSNFVSAEFNNKNLGLIICISLFQFKFLVIHIYCILQYWTITLWKLRKTYGPSP